MKSKNNQMSDYLRWEIERAAAQEEDPRKAIRDLGKIWEGLEDTTALIEARSRLLLRQVEEPKLAPLPKFLEVDLEINQSILPTALLAIQAGMNVICTPANVSMDRAPFGKIEVTWAFKHGLRPGRGPVCWVFSHSELTWPGLRVRVYTPVAWGSLSLDKKRFYNAFDLVDHLRLFSK